MKRRGVSPVIATLLLIVIAVVAAVLAYIWVSGYMGRVTSQAEAGAPQLQEKIKIDAVKVETNNNKVKIYVTNIGDVDVAIASAYVLDENRVAVCSGQFTTDNTISPGATYNFEVAGCSLTQGATYVAKVVTSRGVEATYLFRG